MDYHCKGIALGDGNFSGCDAETTGATDCPMCGDIQRAIHDLEQAQYRRSTMSRPSYSWFSIDAADKEIEDAKRYISLLVERSSISA